MSTSGRYRYFLGLSLLLVIALFLGRRAFFDGIAPGVVLHAVSLDDANWNGGVSNDGYRLLLMRKDVEINGLVAGNYLQFPSDGFRRIERIEPAFPYYRLTLDEPVASQAGHPADIIVVRAY